MLGLLLVGVAGCGFDVGYAIPAVFGELNILFNVRPVEDVLANGRLSDEQRAKINLVLDARAYARDVIGLNVDNSYTQFFDAGDRPVAYNLTASRRDAFEPLTWWFPFVGVVPQLGYFDRWLVDAKMAELQWQGWDVFVYELDAYYLGPALPNPITSPLLNRDDIDLVTTVIHELTHATVGRISASEADAGFSESLATFVGRTGAVQYFRDRMPDQPERAAEAQQSFEDTDRFEEFIAELFEELDAFYKSDRSAEEKIAGRAAIYQAGRDHFLADVLPLMHEPARFDFVRELPVNNAHLLLHDRYNRDLTTFQDVFQAVDQNWAAAIQVYALAAAASGDPYAFMRDWLGSHQP